MRRREGTMSTVVATNYGQLDGLQREGHLAFLGVPFAAPPVGERRFKAPEPPPAWSGTREAKQYGNAARQIGHPFGRHTDSAPGWAVPEWAAGYAARGPQDEDCLYLNVYTPAADDARRPVLFWIHGGGYTHGTASEPIYDGGPLSTRGDVVVVTINYRLGALGSLFLEEHLPGQGLRANCGHLDMIAALEWSRDNISAFGGDPGNVTIFGESAGAWAVGALMAMPGATGLFHKAIMQSGTALAGDRDRARKIAQSMLEELGIAKEPEQIRTISADRILEAQFPVAAKVGRASGPVYGPVVDGVSMLKPPADAVREGESSGIPVLLGTNRDEMKLVAATSTRADIDDATLAKAISGKFPKASTEQVSSLLATYRESRTDKHLPRANLDIMDAILSDDWMRIGATRFALARQQRQANTYLYLFTYESPARGGLLGSCHSLELTFVFGTTGAPAQDQFVGSGPEVERLSANMMDSWLNFARTGDPAHPGIGEWPAYTAESRATMILDRRPRVESDPFGEERQAFEQLL